jgi:MFS family permease
VLVFAATGSAAAVAATFVVHRALPAFAAPWFVARLESAAGLPARPAGQRAGAALVAAVVPCVGLGLAPVLAQLLLDGLLAPSPRALARSALVSAAGPALRETNALVNVVFTVNGVLAPVLAGALIALAGARTALLLDAASFVLAAAAVARIGLTAAGQEGHAPRLREALAYVRTNAVLARLLAGNTAIAVALAAVAPVEVAFLTGTLHQSAAALGTVVTAWGVGMVAGAALPVRGVPLHVLLAAATLALAGSSLGIGAAHGVTEVLAWSVVGGIGNGVYCMALVTTIQERTADAFQTRVAALYETSVSVAPGLGFALGGALAALASPRAVYLVAGSAAVAILAWAAATLVRADWAAQVSSTP